MKTIQIAIATSIIFLFQGCLTQEYQTINTHVGDQKTLSKPIPKSYHDDSLHEVRTYQFGKPVQKNIYSGSIKGIVSVITYNKAKKSWFYEIKGTDTKNYKLPHARFYYKKKLANRGDRVYAILKDSQLQKLYLINKNNQVHHDVPTQSTKHTVKSYKKVKATSIALPEEEHIDF